MKHRHGNAHAVLCGETHAVGEETSVVHQVHVRKQHALGLAGGAGGVLNVRWFIGIWVCGDPVWIAEEIFPLCGIEIDNVLKSQRLSRAGFFEDRFVIRVIGPERVGKARACGIFATRRTARACDWRGLRLPGQPSQRTAELNYRPFGAASRPHTHAIAETQSKGPQAAATRCAWRAYSAQVSLMFWWRLISAMRSANRSAVSRKAFPIVFRTMIPFGPRA